MREIKKGTPINIGNSTYKAQADEWEGKILIGGAYVPVTMIKRRKAVTG